MLAVTQGACSFSQAFHPPAVDASEGIVHQAQQTAGPKRRVEVLFDGHGVPHIYAEHDDDLAYGLGFVHARDRLFQLLLLKHAATGRLGEIFGKGFVEEDRRLRLMTYRLDHEEAALPKDARRLAEAYVAGLNEGAAHAGRSLEMQTLGLNAPPFEVRDLLAIARLQSWQLSLDLRAELARARVVARLPQGDPRRRALLVDVPAMDVPVVRRQGSELSRPDDDEEPEFDVVPLPDRAPAPPSLPAPPPSAEGSFSSLSLPAGSNAWAVHGSRTTSGRPVLVNDPHLEHRTPGVFYLVHLEGPGLSVTGATLPGVPAVLIGHSDHVAWAMTTSFADTQDLVRLQISAQRPDRYVVDGRELPLVRREERFLAGGDVMLTEAWAATLFGPILPPGYAPEMEPGESYAVLWSGFDPEATKDQLLGFWRLARAKDLDEATRALGDVAASQSVLLATREGHIAYRLTGKIPVRQSTEPTTLPRDGSRSAAGWSGYLPHEQHPAVTDPAEGFLVAANQRVVDDDHPTRGAVGAYGATPHRALRIHERLAALLERGPVDEESLLAIQQDVLSVEARSLARHLGDACPTRVSGHPAARLKAFCDEVRNFDGRYTLESTGALPFTLLLASLQHEILTAHLGADVARQLAHHPFVVMALERAILEEAQGTPSPLLDDLVTPPREGLPGFLKPATTLALSGLVDEHGPTPADWTWGDAHTLTHRGPLASAPVIGGVFEGEPRPQSGWTRTVRAEGGLPVRAGAALRFLAAMGDPVRAGIVSDFGNSGHYGDEHYADLVDRWEKGELLELPRTRAEVEKAARGRLMLLPHADKTAPR